MPDQILDARGKPRVQTINDQPSLTVQSDRNQAEISAILSRYKDVGIIDHLSQVDAQFMDVTAFDDFQDVMQHAAHAEHEFMRLPSKLREVFDHDVSVWLDAAHDADKFEALRPKLERLGILEPVAAPAAPSPASEAPQEASDA